MTTDPSDLLMRIAAGDEGALSALKALMERPLARFGTGILGTAAEGDDVAQETLLRAWRHAARFDPDMGPGRVWLYAIARNVARDMLRRRRIRWLVGLDTLESEPEHDAPGPEEAIGDRQRLAEVRGMMAALPDRQRMALVLSAVEDLDNALIAAILGTSIGAVEQLLFRGRRTLRQHMESTENG